MRLIGLTALAFLTFLIATPCWAGSSIGFPPSEEGLVSSKRFELVKGMGFSYTLKEYRPSFAAKNKRLQIVGPVLDKVGGKRLLGVTFIFRF